MLLLKLLIGWPQKISVHFEGIGTLLARIVVGYTFMLTGWAKLQNLAAVTEGFTSWGVPFPKVITPIVAGWECFGGALLLLGLMTRISAGGLAVIMAVAILVARTSEIGSLEDLLGFEEMTYFAVFTWLAISGGGKFSADSRIEAKVL